MRPADADLVRRLRDGDGAAFPQLVDQFSDTLYGLAYSLVSNAADAEDIVQQTFLAAFRQVGTFEGRSSLKTWLVRIALNQSYKLRRSRRVRRMVSLDAPPATDNDESWGGGPPVPETGPPTGAADSRFDVATMLQSLSPEHREVIVLRELERLSYDEIAGVLRVARGTVESRLFRARQQLRRRFEGYLS